MKKGFYLLAILALIMTAVAPAAAAPAPEEVAPANQGNAPQRPDWPDADENPYMVYLPQVAMVDNGPYDVSGYVMDNYGAPIPGVSVTDGQGHTAATDVNGQYKLTLPAGSYTLRPTKDGYTAKLRNNSLVSDRFSVDRDLMDRNFTMVANTAAPLDCLEQFRNMDFEVNDYWNAMSGMAAGYTPYYVRDGTSHATGVSSGFTGVPQGYYQYAASLSRYRSQTFVIPADATTATLTGWLLPNTADTLTAADGKMRSRADYPSVAGLNTDRPEALDEFTSDVYYAFLVNGVTNNAIGDPILWELQDSDVWLTFDLDLLTVDWGQTITGIPLKIEFGTFNDLDLNKTQVYWDDMSMVVCADSIPPEEPGEYTCFRWQDSDPAGEGYMADWNPGFETLDLGWTIAGPEYYEPDWATTPEITPFAGTYSYRTGIAWNQINEYPGVWQWSEGYHALDLSTYADATRIQLSAWVLPRSNYTGGPYPAAANAAVLANESYSAMQDYLAQWDMQYVYLKEADGTGDAAAGEVDRRLDVWWGWNSAWWQYRTFNITAYRGQSISVLFGAANNGWGSNSSLYVDNVDLEICTPLLTE